MAYKVTFYNTISKKRQPVFHGMKTKKWKSKTAALNHANHIREWAKTYNATKVKVVKTH